MKSNLRNEIKSYIVRQGMTMQEVVDHRMNTDGATAFPICPISSSVNLSATPKRYSLPTCWALKSYGEREVIADGSTALRYFTLCQVQGTGD